MCGRSRQMVQPQALASAVGFDPGVPLRRATHYRRRENAHPGNATPIAYRTTRGADALRSMRWGLVPSFTRRSDKPDFFRMFNARSETVTEKPSFRRLVGRRHGVVAFSGFYEWKKDERGEKQPYYFRFQDNRPMLFAVIYDTWRQGESYDGKETGRKRIVADKYGSKAPLKDVKPDEVDAEGTTKMLPQREGEEVQEATVLKELEEDEDEGGSVMFSYAVLTTSAAPRLTWLHERMPVILRGAEDAERWLRVEGSEQASMFFKNHVSYNDNDLVWHPVSKQMNNMRYDGEDCSAPIELKPQKPSPAITSFFKKKPKSPESSTSLCSASAENPLLQAEAKGEKGRRNRSGSDITCLAFAAAAAAADTSLRGGKAMHGKYARVPVAEQSSPGYEPGGGGEKCVGSEGCPQVLSMSQHGTSRELFDLTEDGGDVDIDRCGNGRGSPSVAGLSATGLSPPPGPPEDPSPSTPGVKRPRVREARRNDTARPPKRQESNTGQWSTPSVTPNSKKSYVRGNGGGKKATPRKAGRNTAKRGKTHQPNLTSFFQPSG